MDNEGCEFYARKGEGDFFADVKNNSLFLQALEEDAREKQVDADTHLNSVDQKATQFMMGGPVDSGKTVDRGEFMKARANAVLQNGNSPWSWVARASGRR